MLHRDAGDMLEETVVLDYRDYQERRELKRETKLTQCLNYVTDFRFNILVAILLISSNTCFAVYELSNYNGMLIIPSLVRHV